MRSFEPEPLRVFIGWDDREQAAWYTLAHSIIRRASKPVAITALRRSALPEYSRPRLATESTEFSFTRFLVPYLSGYRGTSLFMDCDMLVKCDIAELWAPERMGDPLRCPDPAVWCVQHDYVPKDAPKMDGVTQTRYPRKNWSSVMLFNNERCSNLTPRMVNEAPAAELHELRWADGRVGKLPQTYNWLVGEYPHNDNAKILHYTLGGPWFPAYRDCDHAEDWLQEHKLLLSKEN